MSRLWSNEWYAAARLADLAPGEGVEVEVAGRTLALFRLGADEVAATDARCPHDGAPLAGATVDGRALRCEGHHGTFALGDAAGEGGDDPALARHPVMVVDERVYVHLPG